MGINNKEDYFHTLSEEKLFESLGTNESGLSQDEADRRLDRYGQNVLPEGKADGPMFLFLEQLTNPFIYILFTATIISFVLGHTADAIFILIVIVISAVVGFIQEYKAERSLELLKRTLTINARVYRNGREEEIDSSLLVPGDMIILSGGDKVPADARIISTQGLEVNESALTGESLPAQKSEAVLSGEVAIADQVNMLFAGTLIENGRAKAVVVSTGSLTQVGKIASSLKKEKEPLTPLQLSFAHFSKVVSIGVLILVLILVVVGFWTDDTFANVFATSLVLAVSAIPAGLPALITIVLVVGMRRLLAHNALVHKLNVTETLGSATVILTDKTGTITHGDMQVSHILTGAGELLSDGVKFNKVIQHESADSDVLALRIALLTTDAIIENPKDELQKSIVRGNAVDRALLHAATQAGMEKDYFDQKYPLLLEVPFDSAKKFSAKVRNVEGVTKLCVVGAPEVIIARSLTLEIDGRPVPLSSDEFKILQEKADDLSKKGLRIVACAYRNIVLSQTDSSDISYLVEQLTFVGFIALKDPVRKEVKGAILLTKQAGIRTIMATGDHKYTALAVAEEIGLSVSEHEIIEGRDIDAMSDADLSMRMRTITICARISPTHKMRIVQALRSNNEVVAMIGDGVNDTPALKVADIGVSVASGTDIAKDTADMVLLDGNFTTIVRAVEQGRLIFQNIKKTVIYLLADDFSEVFVLLGTILLGMPLPLVAAQILWIDLIENGFPATALAFGKDKEGLMQEKPRGKNQSIFSRADAKWLVSVFFVGGAALFGTYYAVLAITGDIELTRTVVFALTAIDSLLFMLIVSSLHRPLLRTDVFSNHYLIWAFALGVPMLIAAVYLPFLQGVLSTVALTPGFWLIIVGVSVLEVLLLELTKYFFQIRPRSMPA